MHAHEHGAPLSDADLDRALEAAFAVEPSPEFVARVRVRIAREPAPSSAWQSWVLAAAGACAVAMVASLALGEVDDPAVGLPRFVANLAAVVPPLAPVPLAVAVAASRGRATHSQKPTAEMRAIMNANAEAAASLRRHVKEQDYAALAGAAETYRQNFSYLAGFWAGQPADGAVEISQAGLTAAAALEAAARAKDDRALETAIAAIIGTCGACHRHHREELPDGSYAIRL